MLDQKSWMTGVGVRWFRQDPWWIFHILPPPCLPRGPVYMCTLDARPRWWHPRNSSPSPDRLHSPHLVSGDLPSSWPRPSHSDWDNVHRDNWSVLTWAPPWVLICSYLWSPLLAGLEAGLRNARCVPIIMLDSLLQWFIFTQTQHNWVWALNLPRETCNWPVTSSRADTLKCSPRTNWASSPLSVSVSLSPMSVLSRSVSRLSLLSQP